MVVDNDFDRFVAFVKRGGSALKNAKMQSPLKCKAKRIVWELLITNLGKVSFCHTCNVKIANPLSPNVILTLSVAL